MPAALRVLLIGGTGFIGGHVARAFIEAGHQVTVLARGRRPQPEGVEMLKADRKDRVALSRALEGRRFDLTVDFAAYDAGDIEQLLLVPYAALGRYFMISTGQVYLVSGSGPPPFREEAGEAEPRARPQAGTRDHANWQYGMGKRLAEQGLLALRASHGVRGVILRLPIVQGEGDGSLRLWAWLERMLDRGPLLLPEGGRQRIRHLWAGDVARALLWLGEHDPPRAAVYNLAQPDVLTLRGFLERVAASAGIVPRFVETSWSEMRGVGLDEDAAPYAGAWCSFIDPSRAAAEWGFIGARADEYLPRVVSWHLDHRPAQSHPGYAQRARELELAARSGTVAG